MSNNKYYKYSAEKLAYVEVYKNLRQKYIKNLPLFIAGFLFCFLLLGILSISIDNPNEKKLMMEKLALKKDFESLSIKINGLENQIANLDSKDDSLYRTILGIEALPNSIKQAGIGGSFPKSIPLNLLENGTPNTIANDIQRIRSKVLVLDNSMNQILNAAYSNKEKMLHIPAIMPIHNKNLRATGSGFGMRLHPILGITRMHEGQDFYAASGTGTKVFATANGTIEKAYYSNTFGNVIIINHGYKLETLYAHLSKFNVKKGQKVKRGDVIGFVGNTGLSSGPHLHYEVHIAGKEVNPVNYFYADLNPEQYEKIIELSEREVMSMD